MFSVFFFNIWVKYLKYVKQKEKEVDTQIIFNFH